MGRLAILYEHPTWFAHLFDVLEKRGVGLDTIRFDGAVVSDPAAPAPAPVIFNRMSMSSPSRRAEHGLFHARALLAHWSHLGARVINDHRAMAYDLSKAAQLSLIHALGLKAPETRVIHRLEDAVPAARAVGFPILVKGNIGGAGAGIVAYEDEAALLDAAARGEVPFGVDGVALVQRKIRKRADVVTRVECLGGRVLYAVDVATVGDVFDLCPADVCRTDAGPSAPVFKKRELDPQTARAAERIVVAAGVDTGGVEFMIDDETGETLFYDINAMSNYVGDWAGVLGWDPHETLADFLVREIEDAAARRA